MGDLRRPRRAGRSPAETAQDRLRPVQGRAGNVTTATISDTITLDTTAPSVTVDQAAGQADPTNGKSIVFTVVFSESVTGVATGDFTKGGTATGFSVSAVSGSGTTYTVTVSGTTVTDGTVTLTMPAGGAADAAGNTNTASTSTDASVTYDATKPTVTVDQAAGQADPTYSNSILFTVVFSEPVTGVTASDFTVGGTATGFTVTSVSGSGTTYTVTVGGTSVTDGTVTLTMPAGGAADAAGNTNTASTSTDNSVTYHTPGGPSYAGTGADSGGGPTIAGAGANATGVGTVAWSNPGYITADDSNEATCSLGGSTVSNYLWATNFGFGIPADAIIDGVSGVGREGEQFFFHLQQHPRQRGQPDQGWCSHRKQQGYRDVLA